MTYRNHDGATYVHACRECGIAITRSGARGPVPLYCPTCKIGRRRKAQRKTPDTRTINVLSLGAGQQSSALLLLSANGALPKLDLAVFADTGWERQVVYRHLDRLGQVADAAGIALRRVTAGRLRDHVMASDFVPMPVFGHHGDRAVVFGQRCTTNFKIVPIRRAIRQFAGPLHGLTVRLWLGISTDEVFRMRRSPVGYIEHTYPLVDQMGWDRGACQAYLSERGFAGAPRSSCVGCPLKGRAEWVRMRDESPDEWADAVAFDAALRARPDSLYLHSSRRPLAHAVGAGEGQGDLFAQECQGHCGL